MLNSQGVYRGSNEVEGFLFLFVLLPHYFKFLLFIILVIINHINTIAHVYTHNYRHVENIHSRKIRASFSISSEQGTILSLKKKLNIYYLRPEIS